ncbi:MAG: GNAT family N-acetyltransferase [Flavobacteriaceae bacterium]|jgi:ribosomal-protein-alanine N-acetyltransferase|nr:GNAT family N-acetyltransferase [Flavobacteriaceae bacterium]
MKKITETNRLILRELDSNDSENFFNLNSDPEVLKYTGDLPFSSIVDAKKFLINYSDYKENGSGRWAVILKETESFIGWSGLKLNEENLVDIGFRFFKKEWGKGYATESAKAVLDYGFTILKLKEIIGRASKDNISSIRVLEKLKMTFWKQDRFMGVEESLYYRIKKNDYIKNINF